MINQIAPNSNNLFKEHKTFSFPLQSKHLLTAKGMMELLRSIAPFMKSQGRELFLKNKSSDSDIKIYLNGWLDISLSNEELRSPDALVISWQKLSSAIDSILSISTKNFPPSRYSAFYNDGELMFLTKEGYNTLRIQWLLRNTSFNAQEYNEELSSFVDKLFYKNKKFVSHYYTQDRIVELLYESDKAIYGIQSSPAEMTDLAIAWFRFLGIKNDQVFEEAYLRSWSL